MPVGLLLPLLCVICCLACNRADASPPTPAASGAPAVASATSSVTEAEAPPAPIASAAPAQPTCPTGEVYIPPTGPSGFEMGRAIRGKTDPPHRVVLTRGFCLDETEVTAGAYEKCVTAGVCKLPFLGDTYVTYGHKPDHPVNMVSWEKARTYCGWVGKRLPTEAEWEWAATGPEGTRYPWGDGPEPECGVGLADFTPLGAPKSNPGGDVGCFGGGTSAVKAHAQGAKRWPGGQLFDMAGNVWEWCEDSYEPFDGAPATDPLVRRETTLHVIKGGGWNRPPKALQGAFRGAATYTYQVPGLGFRCARGEEHPTPPPRAKKWPRPSP